MHMSRIAQFVAQRNGRPRLSEHLEAGTAVGVSPGRRLYTLLLQLFLYPSDIDMARLRLREQQLHSFLHFLHSASLLCL